jgi:hypothetical protein
MSLLGPELVTNGTFASDSDWTKGANWSISAGVATLSSAIGSGLLSQAVSVTNGKTYRVSYEITDIDAVTIAKVTLGGTDGSLETTVATHTEDIIAGSGSDIEFAASGTGGLSIDNVSVKELSTASKIEEAVFDLLRLDDTVYGLVSSRIYPQIIPQNTSLPALEYEIISAPRGHHFTDMTDLVPARFQITAWSETYSNLRTISDAVRNAIDSLQETVGSVEIASCLMIDEVDLVETVPGADQLRRYGRALDFRITYREI